MSSSRAQGGRIGKKQIVRITLLKKKRIKAYFLSRPSSTKGRFMLLTHFFEVLSIFLYSAELSKLLKSRQTEAPSFRISGRFRRGHGSRRRAFRRAPQGPGTPGKQSDPFCGALIGVWGVLFSDFRERELSGRPSGELRMGPGVARFEKWRSLNPPHVPLECQPLKTRTCLGSSGRFKDAKEVVTSNEK